MKKSGLIALLSTSLLLVSCGGTQYVNNKTERINGVNTVLKNTETLTLYSDTFTLVQVVTGNIPAVSVIGSCDMTIQQENRGKLEATNVENRYKLIAEGGSLRMKFEGDGAYTYSQAMKQSFSQIYSYTENQWKDILNDKAVGFVYDQPSEAYVTVNPEDMTFTLETMY